MIIENKTIEVSIICNTYNHRNYIADAINGFLMQKTNFVFEVLVHDDASTDGTTDIIREYQKKYPNIIKPIFEKENQYSKDKNLIPVYQCKRAQGKYIAFCEGDDAWTDPLKLQTQYDILESNSECECCSHQVIIKDLEKGRAIGLYPNKRYHLQSGIVDSRTALIISTNDLFHLNSLMIRTNFYKNFVLNPPEYSVLMPVGDVRLLIAISLYGHFFFIDRIMSVYNKGVPGSFTKRIANNSEAHNSHFESCISSYKSLLTIVDDDFKDIIEERIEAFSFNLALSKHDFETVLSPRYSSYFRKMKFRTKLYYRISALFCHKKKSNKE